MQLRTKLSILVLSAAITPFLLFSSWAYHFSEATARSKVLQSLNAVAEHIELNVTSLLQAKIRDIEHEVTRQDLPLMLQQYLAQPSAEGAESIRRALENIRRASDEYRTVSISEASQVLFSTQADLEDKKLTLPNAESVLFQRQVQFFNPLKTKGDLFFAVAFLTLDQRAYHLVVSGTPQLLNNAVQRYAGLGQSGDVLLAHRLPNGDAEFVVPQRFAEHPDAKQIIEEARDEVPITQALQKHEDTFIRMTDYRGEEVFAATRYLEDFDWGLVVKQDTEEVFAEVEQFRLYGLLIAAVGVILLTLLVFWASCFLFAPLTELTEYAVALRKGENPSLHASILSREDEAGSLARAYSELTTSLLEAKLDLERKVGERTKELERRNRELDSFAHTASHDLRAPLRGIRTLVGWLLSDEAERLSEEGKETLLLLKNRSERLERLVFDFLEFAEMDGTEFSRRETDLTRLIDKTLHTVHIPEGIEVEVRGEQPVLYTEPIALATVLRNLVSNAAKHHDTQRGQISISSELRGDVLHLWVEDDGPGIPEEQRERIFDMLTRLSPQDKVEGSGMGLAFVKKILERRGGNILVCRSEALGGACFEVLWPIETQIENTMSNQEANKA